MKMKIFSLTLLFAAMLAGCNNPSGNDEATQAAASVKNNNAAALTEMAEIQWLDSVKNFGKIKEGEKIIISYRFKNIGNKPLIIEAVNPGCGCTVADKPEAPIAPGGESEIKAAFDSNGRPGATYKTIDVTCNTSQGRYTLVFEGEVIPKSK